MSRDWPEFIPPKTTFLEKVRVHLAWRTLRTNVRKLDAAQINQFAGGRPLSICVFGSVSGPDFGEMMQGLQNSGHRVVGIVSEQPDQGQMPARGLFVHQGSIEEPPTAILAETFDLVILSWVLHSCNHPRQALERRTNYSNPGAMSWPTFPTMALTRHDACDLGGFFAMQGALYVFSPLEVCLGSWRRVISRSSIIYFAIIQSNSETPGSSSSRCSGIASMGTSFQER